MTYDDRPGPRWWPLLLVLGAGLIGLIYIWTGDASQRQTRVMGTALALFLTGIGTGVWLLFLSRLRWKIRLSAFGAGALVLLAVSSLFRIVGVSGDLVPILAWRWSSGSATGPSVTATAVSSGAEGYAFPQFLGPRRNAKVPGPRLARNWETRAPREVWRRPVGAGWSAFAVKDGRAYTQEQHGEEETVAAYDLLTGAELWRHADPTRYSTTMGGTGPRATPTLDGDRVYTVGATGRLNCLNAVDGAVVWSIDMLEDNEASLNMWGTAGSPLLLDSLVIVSPGGPENRSLVAYHRDTGAFVWGGGSATAGYSSPSLHTIAGREQILIFNRGSVFAHDPADGRPLWEYPWERVECISQPLPLPGDRVFVSSGYGIGCKLLQIGPDGDGLKADLVWETPRLKAKFSNVVYYGGFIYGLDDGILVCLDPETGKRRWKRGRYGHGQILLVDDLLLLQTEEGELLLLEISPEKPVELGRIAALEGKSWNNMALAGPYLLMRNDHEAVCYELPLEQTAQR